MTYKVGDRVRIVNTSYDIPPNQIVEILSIDDGGDIWANPDRGDSVDWPEYKYEVLRFYPGSVEPVTESPSGWSTDGNPLLTILEETTAKARQLIIEKGGEYAADTDVLANFRHEAEKLGLPMEVIWHIYIGKHLSAIDRYVRDIKDGKTDRPRMETLESRADDIITYFLHFKMMLRERGMN